MSRRDQLNLSKGPSTGNMRSHSLRATRRVWNVNLHWVTIPVDGKPTRVGFKMDGDKKVRFAKSTGKVID